jgi:Na+/phosphate symporter
MITVSLAKALKLKNKAIEDYNSATSEVLINNSKDVDETKILDAKERYEDVKSLMTSLIALKTKIHEASAPIRSQIFELGELKNLLSRVRNLNTKSGVVKENQYGSGLVTRTFEASITEADKKAEIVRIEALIVTIQDAIDDFNANTTIGI